MGKRKDKKSLKIWDLVIKSLIAIAALITSIAELIKGSYIGERERNLPISYKYISTLGKKIK